MLIYLDINIPHLKIAHLGGNLEVGNIEIHHFYIHIPRLNNKRPMPHCNQVWYSRILKKTILGSWDMLVDSYFTWVSF